MTMTLVDKNTAAAQGLPRFYTGEVCRNGHVAERYVSDSRCVECKAAKDLRHYKLHSESKRATVKAYYVANHEQEKQKHRDYHARKKNDDNYRETRRRYMAKNYEYFLKLQRQRNSTAEAKAVKAAKRKDQAHLYRSYEQKRRARLKNAVPRWYGEFDDFVMTECTALCDLRLAATGFEWQLDHMIPLLARRATGLHCALNVQVIPMWMNRKKNNRMLLTAPLEWLAAL